jgi:hypothetical protein
MKLRAGFTKKVLIGRSEGRQEWKRYVQTLFLCCLVAEMSWLNLVSTDNLRDGLLWNQLQAPCLPIEQLADFLGFWRN